MRAVNIRNLTLACLALGCLTAARPGGSGQSPPPWTVGNSWRVGAWHAQAYRPDKRPTKGMYKLKGRMIAVDFQVTDVKTIGDTECFEVHVTFPKEATGFQRLYRAYYDKESRRLLRLTDVSVLPDGRTKDITTDFPDSSPAGPTFVDDVPGAVPLDWPDRTVDNVSPQSLPAPAGGTLPQGRNAPQTPGSNGPSGSAATAAQTTVPATARSDTGGTVQEDEVTLTKSTLKKESKVVQRWRQNEPWWRTARKFENGILVSESMLLEVNGNKVAEVPEKDAP
jgi:hypothetical protein